MKKFINISLYTIMFLLIVSICIISIKKFFDNKGSNNLENIFVSNFVVDFVSYNKIEEEIIVQNLGLEINNEEKEEVVEKPIVKEEITINKENIKETVENNKVEDIIENEVTDETEKEETEEEFINEFVYDNMSEYDLILKLDKNLKNELSGTSINFVNYYKQTGLDPVLAAAIVLHETGCTWKCSGLVRECYNFGGMKGGTNKYKDTSYTCYSSKEEGINAYLNMLYNNYYAKGLTTPELINPKYAASLEWSKAVNNYMTKIKNSI